MGQALYLPETLYVIMPQAYLYKRIAAARRYMDLHYAAGLTLHDVAGEACLSPFHFLRLFKKAYGCTPHRYLTSKRLDEARQMLAREDLAIAEICRLVGFESTGTFCTLFKKETGHTPAAYRKLMMQKHQRQRHAPRTLIPNCFAYMFGYGEM